MTDRMMLTELREKLHKCPELSLVEYKTSEILENFISNVIRGNGSFKIFNPFHTSIVVEYRNGGELPFKLMRADMDALPVTESENNGIVSENHGVMHACGHDIHMTVLCGMILDTAEKRPASNLLFVFQPGEEGAGGAKKMLETGFFENYKIDSVYALHVTDDHEIGEVASNGSVLFAIPREVDIIFNGKSSHAAFPEKGCDALAASVSFLYTINNILKSSLDPADIFLAHFGKITSGTARNIVSDYSKIEGTLRAFESDVMSQVSGIVEKTAKKCASDFGCFSEMSILGEYVEVRNNPALFEKLKAVCKSTGIKCIEKKGELVGEDFGYFTKKWQGILFWLGTRQNDKSGNPLHSQLFFPSNDVIPVGIKVMRELIK
ncbi:MAG TPA: amidohydrolase [bacterium]|nr:amidohydrolase [bacterium]